jgi:hypothetical protein
MGTEIKSWQIVNGKLQASASTLVSEGRTEPHDLEPWIESNPEIVGAGVAIIGRQVSTKSGPVDLLGIDRSGNPVIIELKRNQLPREALAQAVDYASDVASWTIDKLSEICSEKHGQSLEEYLVEVFEDIDIEGLNVNDTQRIILVGFSIESSLERMIEWLSDSFSVNINAVVLHYTRTTGGDELLTRTSIISEELEQERVKKRKKFTIPTSDEPGSYEDDALRSKLTAYLSRKPVTNQRILKVFLPILLKGKTVTRVQLKSEYQKLVPEEEVPKVGYYLSMISGQLGREGNDFLRQVVVYEYPNHPWEKDNFALREEYRDLVADVVAKLSAKSKTGEHGN